jgi:hypothetical protein
MANASATAHMDPAAMGQAGDLADDRGACRRDGMTDGPQRERQVGLTCPTCGGAVAQTTEGGLPRFACHLGHRFAAAEMGEAQARQTRQVLETALRMFAERSELARRLVPRHRDYDTLVDGSGAAATG